MSNGCYKDPLIIKFIINGLTFFQLVSSYFFYLIKKSNTACVDVTFVPHVHQLLRYFTAQNQGSVDFLTLVHSEITQKITHDPIRLRYCTFSQPKCAYHRSWYCLMLFFGYFSILLLKSTRPTVTHANFQIGQTLMSRSSFVQNLLFSSETSEIYCVLN